LTVTGTPFVGDFSRNKNEPVMCFNAAKSWYTGWYSAGHEEITPSGWDGRLVGVDDFNRKRFNAGAGDRVLLKIPDPGNNNEEDLYVMYNRAKGINHGVVEAPDKVVVVKGAPLTLVYEPSWLVAELDASGETRFISAEHGYGNSRLVIEVTEMTQRNPGRKDYATVSVYYDSNPTPAPTSCGTGDFEIELRTDNYPGETSWEVREEQTGLLVASGSGYDRMSTVYSDSYCLHSNGPFVFTINDSYGDGICCANGGGEYTLTFNGVVVHTGGRFGASESVTFVYEDES
jgi:hypothetical protein